MKEETKSKRFIQELKQPNKEFTPIPFWFFNDAPDREKIEAQLKDYVDKGVHGIVLHPRIGVPKELPYLSEAYFNVMRMIVGIAASLDMQIVLYDEAMYPSGSAHGMVVERNPEYASRGITLVQESELQDNMECIARLSDGRCIAYGFTHGTIRGIHFGEDDGEVRAPKSADILNPEAVDEFIRLTHDKYYEELKEYFGTTIIAFFTDEPSALGRNTVGYHEWVKGMEQELSKQGGKIEELSALFEGKENATTEIYHKLIKKNLREIFYAKLSNWCESHGIMLMGHPEASDDVEEELYFHIPGQDLILRRVSPETGGLCEFDSVQAKLTADIARCLGRRRNANECFGVCNRGNIPWYFTGKDMIWYINWLGMRGVNLFVPHAFYYSVEGDRKDERPPDVGPNNIWWQHYKQISDYMKRFSYLMTDSQNGAQVAVLCDNNKVPYKEVAYLYEHQIEFNYLPVALLKECKLEQGKLCIGVYRYSIVLDAINANPTLEGVRVVTTSEDITCKIVETSSQEPNLRVSKIHKNGNVTYLFCNEGEDTINTTVIVPEKAFPIVFRMWEGDYYAIACKTLDKGTAFDIQLKSCETIAIIMAEQGIACRNEDVARDLGDWTNELSLESSEKNCMIYARTMQILEPMSSMQFSCNGQEMAECYCNGVFAGFSLYEPHVFSIGKYLKKGENVVKVHFTGNAANVYANAEIPVGI